MNGGFLRSPTQQYGVITANYWAFTLTDGALRMLIVLHFHQLGYSPLQIAALFLFYEFFGIVTNLLGGYVASRVGLNRTMNAGLALQVSALLMLSVSADWLTVGYVMLAQALSGIAKDLNKMSAKSAIKLLVNEQQQGKLYRWVARLTGSKNALKGMGFFLGAVLLSVLGFSQAMLAMAAVLALVWLCSVLLLQKELGKSRFKAKFKDIWSKSAAINRLSAARLLLFAARDVWFVVALPVYLSRELGWSSFSVGGFLALWVIGYGAVQAVAPAITRTSAAHLPDGTTAWRWAARLALLPIGMAIGLGWAGHNTALLLLGLLLFGVLFAINSALHSYLIVSYAARDGVSLDVGFYYMSNAAGRLLGTLLSGWVFMQSAQYGLVACLAISGLLIALAALVSRQLPANG